MQIFFFRHDFWNSISLDSRLARLNCILIKSYSIFFSVIDCLLSEWGPWSECDAKCGTGTRSRTRSILRAPENGGKHCVSLTQKQGCEGYRCKSLHERKALSGEHSSDLKSFLGISRLVARRKNSVTRKGIFQLFTFV